MQKQNLLDETPAAPAEADEFQPPTTEYDEEYEVETTSETAFEADAPQNTGACLLLSISYRGRKGKALVKLLEPKSGRIYFWYDNTGHQPYCLSDLSPVEIGKQTQVKAHPGFARTEEVERYNTLLNRLQTFTVVYAKDPLSIGGKKETSIRDMLPRAWEAKIRYHDCYAFDRRLIPGMAYQILSGELVAATQEISSPLIDEVQRAVRAPGLGGGMLEEWLPLFLTPAPSVRRVALDIEVYTPVQDRIPNPKEAEYAIICAALASSDGHQRVLVLKTPTTAVQSSISQLPEGVKVDVFEDERELVSEIFHYLNEYPVVLTFNGDSFDLAYIWHRAQRLGFRKEEIPINLGKNQALLPIGVHIDLYKFFDNRSVQIYAFEGKYKENTLDAISQALLGMRKIPIVGKISELTGMDLAAYCFRDARLTLSLTTFDNDLVMNFILLLMRISKMSMEDVTRQKVSGWIRNLFYFEHRKRNYLIPQPEDIKAVKGEASTKSIIKGKKYKGAIVMEPETGVYFKVAVLDFASLYPGIISRWNLSYESIRCIHEECRGNAIPGTSHWACKREPGLSAQVIGMLRDLRVNWIKPKSKDPSLDPALRHWFRVVQQGVKVILNASYGVFGAENFHFYCPPVAESTSALGRQIIQDTIDYARSDGTKVIYGDTDSIFLHEPTQEQISSLMGWSRQQLGIDLDLDKMYRYVVFSQRKKNYLAVFEDGSVDIKGLVGKKSNTPAFVKGAFYQLVDTLSKVQDSSEFDQAKENIRQIVTCCYANLKNRRYNLDDLAIRIMISKPTNEFKKTTPAHVKAAKQLEKLGRRVAAGDIISYVKTKDDEGVRTVQLARVDEVDVDKYLEYVKTAFGQVLDALDLDLDQVMGNVKLEHFFGG